MLVILVRDLSMECVDMELSPLGSLLLGTPGSVLEVVLRALVMRQFGESVSYVYDLFIHICISFYMLYWCVYSYVV